MQVNELKKAQGAGEGKRTIEASGGQSGFRHRHAQEHQLKKWKMPIPNWSAALNRFSIEFVDRMPNQYK